MVARKCRNIKFPKCFMAVRKFTNVYHIPKYFCTSVNIHGNFTFTSFLVLFHMSCATTTLKKATDQLNVA